MMNLIEETTDYLKEKGFETPEIGIILGTGLGQLIDHMELVASSLAADPDVAVAVASFLLEAAASLVALAFRIEFDDESDLVVS